MDDSAHGETVADSKSWGMKSPSQVLDICESYANDWHRNETFHCHNRSQIREMHYFIVLGLEGTPVCGLCICEIG